MPSYLQHDIFTLPSDLIIVFGHTGLGWTTFRLRELAEGQQGQAVDSLAADDPFGELADRPLQYAPGRWIWLVHDRLRPDRHGMTDEEIETALRNAVSWARQTGLHLVVTNGARESDLGRLSRVESDDQRAHFLGRLAAEIEEEAGLAITLASMDDVFTRNFANG